MAPSRKSEAVRIRSESVKSLILVIKKLLDIKFWSPQESLMQVKTSDGWHELHVSVRPEHLCGQMTLDVIWHPE